MTLNNCTSAIRSCLKTSVISICVLIPGISFSTQAEEVHFDFHGVGEKKEISEWGVEVAWISEDNIRQSIFHMGEDQIDVIFANFYLFEALNENGELGPEAKGWIDTQVAVAAELPDATWGIGPSVNDTAPYYYQDENWDNPLWTERWYDLIKATKNYYNQTHGKTISYVMPFNEPDWWWGQGTPDELRDILTYLEADPEFDDIGLMAASTLCSCAATWWYDQVSDIATHGTTHQLGGSADDFANFFEHVVNTGNIAYNPELHSLGEALYNAEHGVTGGAWWGAVLRSRGLFVKTNQGTRLGYAENRDAPGAAAVYRSPTGDVYGFAGAFERQGRSYAFTYVSEDQDLYFDGVGPVRKFSVPVNVAKDVYVHIDDKPGFPTLGGHRWKIVNVAGNKVLEVEADHDGANISTAKDTDSDYQKWDIYTSGDGYYSFVNAATGKAVDDAAWSLEDGANIQQWHNFWSLNQKFWIEPTGDGDGSFYIRNGHSNLYMEDDKARDKNVQQSKFEDSDRQKWYFVNADPIVAETTVAHYEFEDNLADSHALNDANAPELAPGYTAGPQGQALQLDGQAGQYVSLPEGIAENRAMTVAAWVKWDGGNAQQRIFDFGINQDRYMYLTPSDFDGKMSFGITTANWQHEAKVSVDAMPVGEWFHITYTQTGNVARIYVNGELEVTGAVYTTPAQVFDVPADWAQQNYIGKSQWPDPAFNGAIDDFRIYNHALSADEVAALLP